MAKGFCSVQMNRKHYAMHLKKCVKSLEKLSKYTHQVETAKVVSYWTLFALVIFGPCEPLIPLIFAGYAYGWLAVIGVFAVFGLYYNYNDAYSGSSCYSWCFNASMALV